MSAKELFEQSQRKRNSINESYLNDHKVACNEAFDLITNDLEQKMQENVENGKQSWPIFTWTRADDEQTVRFGSTETRPNGFHIRQLLHPRDIIPYEETLLGRLKAKVNENSEGEYPDYFVFFPHPRFQANIEEKQYNIMMRFNERKFNTETDTETTRRPTGRFQRGPMRGRGGFRGGRGGAFRPRVPRH